MSRMFLLTILAALFTSQVALANDRNATDEVAVESKTEKTSGEEAKPTPATTKSTVTSKTSSPKYSLILKNAKRYEGVITTYRTRNKLVAELSSQDYRSEFIVLISIARGIGRQPLLGGMTWGFGDDWVWTFRKVDDRVHIVRKNVRFRASKGSPEASAVRNAYTDSVIFSLPVLTKGPKGGDLVDLTPVFMSDLPQISQVLPGFSFSVSKSAWGTVKPFKDNIEIEVSATYASNGRSYIETVPDSRGVTIGVHYSLSKIPQTGYRPRVADDRVGYFVTAVKDYSSKESDDRFVRYINRWHLQKADASSSLSPPKEPIIFWLEKTIPFKYRKPIRDGILEWNKAFAEAGFIDAIEVRQQPNDATWDPEDINYNTFRWITSSVGLAMGPSRVNPYTGQILDADIIFDADFLDYWQDEYETFSPKAMVQAKSGHVAAQEIRSPLSVRHCYLSRGIQHQFAFGATALIATSDIKQTKEEREKLLMQGLKEVAMHEVGHTLGLRHNFRASAYLTAKELREGTDRPSTGLSASVMDYNAINIASNPAKQREFFSTTIGPYDQWAIEYGYKSLPSGSAGRKALKEIASRSGQPGLAFSTDEELSGFSPDPYVNAFDLGDDPVQFAKDRADLVAKLLPKVVDRMTVDGDNYVKARRAFNVLMSTRGEAMLNAARIIGGLRTSRSHKGDKDASGPIEMIDPQQQRAALELISDYVFKDDAYQLPGEIYNKLGPNRWSHWGARTTLRLDYPIHNVINMWQSQVLTQLLSADTLGRMLDTELKIPADEDAYTVAELMEELSSSIFAELKSIDQQEYSSRKPAISSTRRNLQRQYLQRLSWLAMGRTGAPADCETIAYAQLTKLEEQIEELLEAGFSLDAYTLAHLQESSQRIRKVRESVLTLPAP